ncbi:MAG: RND family transporter, partial [Rubrivivax sp.]|nr:RND family transporter [Rubrivivax sp.]
MNAHSCAAPEAAEPFDRRSGSLVERALFNNRAIVVALCLLVTAVLGWQATKLQLNASFEKTIPTHHPYIQNFLAHQGQLTGLGNALRIAVANPEGSIYDAGYLETLRKLSDEVFLLPGVARTQMKSLWTPTTRWVGVTEDGLE